MKTPVVLIVADDDATRQAIVAELDRELPSVAVVLTDADEAVGTARALVADGRVIAVILVGDVAPPLSSLLADLHLTAGADTRVLLVTAHDHLDGLGDAITGGHLHGIITRTWTAGEFGRHLAVQIRRGQRAVDRGQQPKTAVEDSGVHGRARALEALEAPDDVAAQSLVQAIDRALGHRPRLWLAAGTSLVREGEEVNGIFIIVSGDVRLSRHTAHGEQSLHRTTTGPVIGLLSLTQQRLAFVTAVTTSPVVAVHVTLEQMDEAMGLDGDVATIFSAVLLRALANRLVRADELHLEVRGLNRKLAEERDRVAEAMARLEAAEVQLIDSARMATLGELSAGIAHELNNPAGALQRAASHLAQDVASLLTAADRAVLEAAITAPPPSSAAQRRARRSIEALSGDADLAARLVRAGVTEPDEARRLVLAGAEALARRTTLHQLGTAVRNTTSASQRIAGLVASLRAYVRGDATTERTDVDILEGLDETLSLLGHRLVGVDVERRYARTLPAVRGSAGELNQVWTNLLANTAEALAGAGTVTVDVDAPSDREVRIRITDDGPGVPPEDLPRLFEPRFTTKAGRVEYGLGLGLSIAKRIVDAHGGTISMTSEPGRTVATVVLPAAEERSE